MLRRMRIWAGTPARIELGEHSSWKVANPKKILPLVLEQVDRVEGTIWVCTRVVVPGHRFTAVLEVERDNGSEKFPLILTCEE